MDFEKDFFMRMIQNMVRFLMQLVTGKSQFDYKIKDTENPTTCDDTYARIIAMADSGRINEAENLLYENLESGNQDYLLMGISFYNHINDYSDDFLAKHNYTREEIETGIQNLAGEFEITGLELLVQSFEPM